MGKVTGFLEYERLEEGYEPVPQRVKNWNTVAARALKRVDSPYAFVLTGTPLENRLEELISIVQLVDQHRLGPTWRLLHEHQQVDDAGRVVGYRDLDRIGATLAPIAQKLPELPAGAKVLGFNYDTGERYLSIEGFLPTE